MTTERPEYRSVGFRLFVVLAVLVNLILTIALITQVREVQQGVAKLPPADFYALPLGERIELLTSSRIKFEKDKQPISPLDALRKK